MKEPVDTRAVVEGVQQLTGHTPTLTEIRFARNAGAIGLGVGMIVMSAIALGLLWGSGKVAQFPRDRWAQGLGPQLTAGESVSFILFLRPFNVTNKLLEPLPFIPPISVAAHMRSPHRRFELTLFKALDRVAPVIGLGRPGEAVGVSRIAAPESEWQTMVAFLVEHASSVVCLPSHHTGTRWEIHLLMTRKLLFKTVFVMPPWSEGIDMQNEWTLTATALDNLGIQLPSYHRNGAAFTLDETGALSSLVWLRTGDARNIAQALAEVNAILSRPAA